MVYYECVVTAKHTTHFKSLTELCKSISRQVVEDGGIVTSVQNHGIREFPHRYQAKYPDYLTQQRSYQKGRLFSIWYESSPQTQSKVSQFLEKQFANNVLRYTQLQSQSKLSQFANLPQEVATTKTYTKNPYVKNAFLSVKQQQQFLAEEEEAEEAEEKQAEAQDALEDDPEEEEEKGPIK